VRKGAWSVSTTVASAPLDNTQSVAIQLHNGWNLITNPFDGAVSWSAVQSVNGALARGQLWGYNGSYSAATSMEPYAGYYFYADSVGSLRIPYGAVSGVLKADEVPSNVQWMVDIELRGDEFVERATSFGISDSAKDGLDQYDYRKPRAIGDIPGISFRRPEFDADYSNFARDIRSPIQELAKWTFEVRSTDRKHLTLAFDRPEVIPDEYEAYVIDLTHAKGVNLRTAAEYSFAPVTNLSEFAVVVGRAEAVQRELNEMVPKEFALGNNFPNPFNPSTTIPVAVPQTADVVLKVFNILGEEIRALHDGPLEAGRYWFTWDGRNGFGSSVASGVYFVRMTTNSGKKFVGKMLLMK
jgi:hypothetical protein